MAFTRPRVQPLTTTHVRFVSNRKGRSIYAVVDRPNGSTEVIEILDDLSSPNWTTSGLTETGATAIDSDFELVTIRVETPVGESMEKGFIRLTISLSE